MPQTLHISEATSNEGIDLVWLSMVIIPLLVKQIEVIKTDLMIELCVDQTCQADVILD